MKGICASGTKYVSRVRPCKVPYIPRRWRFSLQTQEYARLA